MAPFPSSSRENLIIIAYGDASITLWVVMYVMVNVVWSPFRDKDMSEKRFLQVCSCRARIGKSKCPGLRMYISRHHHECLTVKLAGFCLRLWTTYIIGGYVVLGYRNMGIETWVSKKKTRKSDQIPEIIFTLRVQIQGLNFRPRWSYERKPGGCCISHASPHAAEEQTVLVFHDITATLSIIRAIPVFAALVGINGFIASWPAFLIRILGSSRRLIS